VALAILLDEHISLEIAYRLTELGFDVVPLRDRGLLKRKDWQLMQWCREHDQVICTRNSADFETEHQRCRDRGEDHPGVLVVGRDWSQEEIFWALWQFLETNPDLLLLQNQVLKLPEATPDFIQERSQPP
jgi:predicted nuclease of predicted toxin-antitoxin system